MKTNSMTPVVSVKNGFSKKQTSEIVWDKKCIHTYINIYIYIHTVLGPSGLHAAVISLFPDFLCTQ